MTLIRLEINIGRVFFSGMLSAQRSHQLSIRPSITNEFFEISLDPFIEKEGFVFKT